MPKNYFICCFYTTKTISVIFLRCSLVKTITCNFKNAIPRLKEDEKWWVPSYTLLYLLQFTLVNREPMSDNIKNISSLNALKFLIFIKILNRQNGLIMRIIRCSGSHDPRMVSKGFISPLLNKKLNKRRKKKVKKMTKNSRLIKCSFIVHKSIFSDSIHSLLIVFVVFFCVNH
jgi:hypothetical protein